MKRLSDARCVEGQSWGQRGDRIWVSNGCRAKFEVTRTGGGGSNLVDCSSDGGRYRECQIGSGYFGRLERDLSNGRCRENSTWGTRNGVIWVTDGCRARFAKVRGNGGGSGSGGGNRRIISTAARRMAACRSAASAAGIGPPRARVFVGPLPAGLDRGTREGVVWVTNGCMAQFERTGNGNGGGWSGGSSAAQAEQACIKEVQRRGARILQQNAAVPIAGGYRMQLRVRMPAGRNALTWAARTRRKAGRFASTCCPGPERTQPRQSSSSRGHAVSLAHLVSGDNPAPSSKQCARTPKSSAGGGVAPVTR